MSRTLTHTHTHTPLQVSPGHQEDSCTWRAIPGPLSKRKRRLDSLEAAQGAPRDPRRDSRPEFLPGESQGRGSLVWGRKESDTTE